MESFRLLVRSYQDLNFDHAENNRVLQILCLETGNRELVTIHSPFAN